MWFITASKMEGSANIRNPGYFYMSINTVGKQSRIVKDI